ncbi:MAG: VWA domain-containing protein [Rubrobacteraceae bacterium]
MPEGSESATAPPMLDAAVAFGRVLRGAGLRVGTDRIVEFSRALEELDAGRRNDVYWSGRVTLLSRPEDLQIYDRAFKVFWERGGGDNRPGLRRRSSSPVPEDSVAPPKKTVEQNDRGEDAVALRYSPVEILRSKDFALYSSEEFAELQRLLSDLHLSGALRRSRRLESAPRGRHDPRRTLRGAMRTGGEAVRHRFRKARVQPRRVVLLCDVSGSMGPYSRALLRFLHAGVISGARLEAFSMGTRLTRITKELGTRDPDQALRQTAGAVPDLSGGTRLGDVIKDFVDRWGQRGMARGAVVVVLSDGWDRGDVSVLAEQMERISRLAYKVIWVNPLKAAPGYQPLAGGMAAALPHVDVFLSGHNFESLEALAQAIAAAAERDR